MVKQLFEALMNGEKLLPRNDRLKIHQKTSDSERARVVCDYIAWND